MGKIKMVVIGDERVGKSGVLRSFAVGDFPDSHVPTVFGTLVDR